MNQPDRKNDRRNAFAITDSASIHDNNDDKRQIALAVYPAASLFNHSCTPNCIVSFDGPRIFVRTTEAVSARSPLLISYGPTATRTPDRSARQKLLQLQYCFTCGCPSCSSTQDTRTPIDAWLCPCSAAVPPRSTQCPVCQSPLDVPAIERDLQDADTAFATARSHLDKQEPHPQSVPQLKRALELRLRRLHRFNRTLGYTWDSLAQALALNGDFKGATGMLERSIAVVTNAFGPDSIELANELLKYAEIALQRYIYTYLFYMYLIQTNTALQQSTAKGQASAQQGQRAVQALLRHEPPLVHRGRSAAANDRRPIDTD